MYQPRNILVTGAAGFIGSHFVDQILQTYPDALILGLDKLTYAGNRANLASAIDKYESRFHFIEGDIAGQQHIETLLDQFKVDTIVNFAAETHVDRSIASPTPFIESNVVGTVNLLTAAKSIWLDKKKLTAQQCRFHHISTDEVYGSLSHTAPAFTETTPYTPRSPYSASKAAADHFVQAYWHTYGLPVVISNCSNNYGPRQHTEKLIPTIIQACLNKQAIPIYGQGINVRDWLYVSDHCHAILNLLHHAKVGETYNIGGNCEQRNIDLVHTLCRLMNKMAPSKTPYESLITFVEDRPGHDQRYAIEYKKIETLTGWQPTTSLANGLSKTIQHYLDTLPITSDTAANTSSTVID